MTLLSTIGVEMSEIEYHRFGSETVAFMMIDGDDTLYVNLRDLGDALGITLSGATMAGVLVLDQPPYQWISEGDAYALAFRSQAPGAIAFQRWVTHTVLPQYRRTGSFEPAAQAGSTVAVPSANPMDLLQAMLDQMRSQSAELTATNDRLDVLTAVVEGSYERVSALGFAKSRGLPTSVQYLNRLGQCARRIADRKGVPVERVHSVIFGTVNAWPMDIWEEAADNA